MTAKISKWGNSQGLRMPKDIMETLHLHVGDDVNITILDGKVILEPIKKDILNYDLNDLISKIPSNYKTTEEFDTIVGKEEW
ncbi:AbrB/MazE/SpoVT family DNA-binding domain-containing protein [Aliarcobacter butzleri]|uniref:AbrB/MazE/SpoVT family DNA-binding domain-containing protein n=1 Tax=Aliarcobacter butzleri TaxID=28197 RepID=UPI00125FBDFA|nr:AbrB/MazE/SpoVT family DNA-binding domain-containing protein [Aliarcobacter butzleri]MCG3715074.1 AbrB/MazE/SpoVT family DNA-binding domain-containing protein [Aliarcobacter butzleri]MCT7560665.1 AbrB/MazE/SpoVT family DNA-binding domain-containing protein [Aliarcobacter butzleri]MCT7612165.1 AbrB/MazE/SpoVT family DNA-binding domain-containing protein [Aliarcobacter butzleri]MCT7627111.1 AbrB/MazE/SpoVT family DNA-binding domain-containing protein [Aliarcobacter butzleri]MCT7640907.1 AbrB/